MAAEESLPVKDRVGEEVTVNGRRYRIIGDDRHSKSLKKEWDLWLRDIETGIMKKFLAEEITDSSQLPIQ